MENRNGLVVDVETTQATGKAEREAALKMAYRTSQFGSTGHAALSLNDIMENEETDMENEQLAQIARWIAEADGLIVTAGAGMGVDSGLPDFRGDEGFWRAYPALGRARLSFTEIANAQAFSSDPWRAWGFYGHRLALYRQTEPHAGFAVLRRIGDRLTHGAFAVTSNVDGQFQKAGFDTLRVMEIHGSIHHLQCLNACSSRIWPAAEIVVATDDEHCRWTGAKLPACPDCGGVARPNILMFDDWTWNDVRTNGQRNQWTIWRAQVKQPVVIELGAGVDLPSIRRFSLAQDAPVVRINVRHPAIDPARGIAISMRAGEALAAIERHLVDSGFFG